MNQNERMRKILEHLVTNIDQTGMIFGAAHPVYVGAKEILAEEPEEPGSNPNSIEERLSNLEAFAVSMMKPKPRVYEEK